LENVFLRPGGGQLGRNRRPLQCAQAAGLRGETPAILAGLWLGPAAKRRILIRINFFRRAMWHLMLPV
jgi:hypothetical protein